MCKRDLKTLKTYEQYAVDYELAKDFATTQITQNEVVSAYKSKYEKMFLDYLLMLDVVDDISNENKNDVIVAIKNADFENGAQEFYDSFNKSTRITFLHPYTVEDLN